jgi:hypothetical protein
MSLSEFKVIAVKINAISLLDSKEMAIAYRYSSVVSNDQ